MARNYRQSDYAKNKYSSNIVYAGSDETIEITLEQFLKENHGMTEEDFLYWKNWSDEDYLEQIRRETNIKKHEFLFNDSDETELFWIPSAEDVVIEKLHRENKRMYTMEDVCRRTRSTYCAGCYSSIKIRKKLGVPTYQRR